MKLLKVGFVGLGGMGRGLVKNMLKHGVSVRVFDIDPDAVAAVVAMGAVSVDSVEEMAGDVDVLSVCVTTAEVVQEIALGEDGVLSLMKKEAVFLDHTTTSPDHVDMMSKYCGVLGISYCEAPMTRTPLHADRGEVNILFGGEESLLEKLRP